MHAVVFLEGRVIGNLVCRDDDAKRLSSNSPLSAPLGNAPGVSCGTIQHPGRIPVDALHSTIAAHLTIKVCIGHIKLA